MRSRKIPPDGFGEPGAVIGGGGRLRGREDSIDEKVRANRMSGGSGLVELFSRPFRQAKSRTIIKSLARMR